jgi:predicted ATP-grasp superfamily ATP-dependent carboligase
MIIKCDAVVLKCNNNGLNVIQSLGRLGLDVVAIDSKNNIGFYSKYTKKSYKFADPLSDEKKLLKQLKSLVKDQKNKPFLIATNDDWARVVAKYYSELELYYTLCSPNHSAFELIIEKKRFYEWAKLRSYNIPLTYSSKELKNYKIQYPIIAKPEYRRNIIGNAESNKALSNYLDKNRLSIINSDEQLEEFIKLNSKYLDYFLFQEYIPGDSSKMYTVGVYANKNYEVKALFNGRKIRGYPASYGDCMVGQSEILPKEVNDEVFKLIKEIQFSGIAEIEYKIDDEGKFRLIEINPRTWSWVGITPECGVDLVAIAYKDLVLKEIKEEVRNMSVGTADVKFVRMIDDYLNCLFFYKKDYPKWSLTNYKEWKRNINANKIIFAEYAKDDKMPLIYALVLSVKGIIKKIING